MIVEYVEPATRPRCGHVIHAYGGEARECGGPAAVWADVMRARHYRCPRHAADLPPLTPVTYGVVQVLR